MKWVIEFWNRKPMTRFMIDILVFYKRVTKTGKLKVNFIKRNFK